MARRRRRHWRGRRVEGSRCEFGGAEGGPEAYVDS